MFNSSVRGSKRAATRKISGWGLYLFTLSLEGEPAYNGCGLYLEPAYDKD